MTRKLLVLALALMLALSSFAVVSAEKEVVTLTWYTVATECADHQMVMDALNAYTEEKIGVRVDLRMLSSADFKTKVPVMLNAGQEVDIVFSGTSYSTAIATFAKSGAFLAIDEYIDEYLPLTKAAVPEFIWNGPSYDGKIYGVPVYKDMASNGDILYNKTLLAEVGIDVDAVANFEWNGIADWKDLLYEVKDKMDAAGKTYNALIYLQDDLKYYGAVDNLCGSYFAATNIPGKNTYDGYEVGEVFNVYATDEFREWCLLNNQMVRDGILPVEKWTSLDPDDAIWKGGELPFRTAAGYVFMAEDQWSDQWKAGISFSQTAVCDATTVGKYANCVTTSSKHPIEALKFLDLVNGDPYVATLLRFGIENSHWKYNEDGKTITFQFDGSRNADSTNRGYYYWYGWTFGNLFIMATPTDVTTPDFIDLLGALNASATPSDYIGFKFVNDNVVDEIAACKNVVDQYYTALWHGFLGSEDEVNATLDAFIQALNDNGVQTIIDEVQAQLDAYKLAK